MDSVSRRTRRPRAQDTADVGKEPEAKEVIEEGGREGEGGRGKEREGRDGRREGTA